MIFKQILCELARVFVNITSLIVIISREPRVIRHCRCRQQGWIDRVGMMKEGERRMLHRDTMCLEALCPDDVIASYGLKLNYFFHTVIIFENSNNQFLQNFLYLHNMFFTFVLKNICIIFRKIFPQKFKVIGLL